MFGAVFELVVGFLLPIGIMSVCYLRLLLGLLHDDAITATSTTTARTTTNTTSVGKTYQRQFGNGAENGTEYRQCLKN